MMWIVEKHNEIETGTYFNWAMNETSRTSRTEVTQVGAPCKTAKKAMELKQRMRAQQPAGSSAWFTIRQVRKAK